MAQNIHTYASAFFLKKGPNIKRHERDHCTVKILEFQRLVFLTECLSTIVGRLKLGITKKFSRLLPLWLKRTVVCSESCFNGMIPSLTIKDKAI